MTKLSAPPRAAIWIRSMVPRSIVTLPMSRVSDARLPLAEMLKVSLMFAPLNMKRVETVLAINDIAAVAGIPDERVVTVAESRGVAATAAGDHVVAVAAKKRVIAVAAGDRVIAGAAIDRELDEAGEAIAGGEDVIAAIHIENEIFRCADVEEERRRVGAVETNAGAVGRNREIFCAVSAVDFGGIRAVAAFEEIAAVARVPDHPVIAGLAEHLVVARAAGEHIVAVATEQQVVAPFAKERVVSALPEEQVICRAAGQDVVAVAAEKLRGRHWAIGFVDRDRVIATLAEQLDQIGIGDGRVATKNRNGAAVDQDVSGRITAGRDAIAVPSPNTDSTRAPGKKLAVIAMVIVLSKVWMRRKCALAVGQPEPDAYPQSGLRACSRPADRLDFFLRC